MKVTCLTTWKMRVRFELYKFVAPLIGYTDDDGGEMDEDDEDEQMFLGLAGHSRHLPFGWEGDIDSPVIVSRGHNRYVTFSSSLYM